MWKDLFYDALSNLNHITSNGRMNDEIGRDMEGSGRGLI
jgi:hypothetical protein